MFLIHFVLESAVSLAVWGLVGYYANPYLRRVLAFVPAPPEKRRVVQAATYSFLLTALVGSVFYLLPFTDGYGLLEFAGVWLMTGFVEYSTHKGTSIGQ